MGIPHTPLFKPHCGKTEPSLENLVKLADMFDVSVDYLLGRTDY